MSEISKYYQREGELVKMMIERALKARQNAYAPYSRFLVGAAVKAVGNDKIYTGCNVENVSFGATVCAERTAIFSMVADAGRQEIESVVVATQTSPPSLPCALCLQVINEFCSDCEIVLVNEQGETITHRLRQLLPHAFKEDSLKKSDLKKG